MQHRRCKSDARFHIRRRCQFMCAVSEMISLIGIRLIGLSSVMILPLWGFNKERQYG